MTETLEEFVAKFQPSLKGNLTRKVAGVALTVLYNHGFGRRPGGWCYIISDANGPQYFWERYETEEECFRALYAKLAEL
jgi:hypothetical protein